VDINTFFNDVAANGYQTNGLTFTTKYLEGGMFGVDGVHPTNQGYAIIANQFIKTINEAFGASIPEIDVSTIPGGIILAKKVKFNKYGIPLIPPHSLDNIVF
jgi:succinyl-CoA synthetase alpha subunit